MSRATGALRPRQSAPAADSGGTTSFDDRADSPLARARIAARSRQVAAELAALERAGAPAERIAEQRAALRAIRACLCGSR